MSSTHFTNHALEQEGSRARPDALFKAVKNGLEIDKVTALAILAASAIFAPFAIATLHQAAKIFAH
jgi:hypothetical protein